MKRMTKLFALVLSVITILSTLVLPTWALSKPAGSAEGSNVPELQPSTDPINMDNLLTKLLTTSPDCSVKGILDTNWVTAPDITEESQADIANHFKYGFSVAGIAKLQRAVWGAIDSVWTTGNRGGANTAGASMYGAFSYRLNEYLYNYKGEKVLNPADGSELAEGESYPDAPEGFDYQMLWTFNFGYIANIDSFGFTCAINQLRALPQAADIYVSNDGVNWTLVGYYDRIAKLLKGEDYPTIYTQAMLGPDVSGNIVEDTNSGVWLFDLPEGTKGQFMRIGFTANFGKTDDIEKYGEGQRTWYEPAASYYTFREAFVFGTLTEEQGFVYDPSMDTTTPTEDGETEEQTTIQIITKPVDTTVPVTEKPTDEAKTDDQGKDDEKKGGCGATVGFGLVAIVSISAAGVMLTKRRRNG